jgi:hypothetical protein
VNVKTKEQSKQWMHTHSTRWKGLNKCLPEIWWHHRHPHHHYHIHKHKITKWIISFTYYYSKWVNWPIQKRTFWKSEAHKT